MILTKRKQQSWITHIKKNKKLTTKNGKKTINSYYVTNQRKERRREKERPW